MKTKITTVLAILLLVSMAGFSQRKHSITGKVLDENGGPIPFATVLLGNGGGVVTGLDGSFLATVSETELATEVNVSYVGYKDKSQTWFQSAAPNTLVFTLTPGIDLPVVEVISVNFRSGCVLTRCCCGPIHCTFPPKKVEAPLESGTVKITDLKAYPNPFIATLTLEMEVQTPQPYLFQLYNEAGQLVFAESRDLEAGPQSFQLDLAQRHLPEGAYFLRISDDAGEVRTKRLVKVSP